jgi:signal transduction histidine kinase
VLLAKTLRSSTFRVALLCVGVFGAATAVLIIYLSTAADRYLRLRYDGAIAAEERLLQDAYLRQGEAEIARVSALDAGTQEREGSVVLLGDHDFRVLTGSETAWPEPARVADGWVEFSETRGEGGASSLVRARVVSFADGNRLLVGRRLAELDDFARAIDTGVVAGLALLLVIAGAAGILVTRRTVARIETINATSGAIMASGLGKRIPLRGTRDEWDQLAENLNSMLARIEELVTGIKQVSDNVAHDLRTPLMRIRGRLEVALRQRPAEKDYEQLIQRTVADLDDVLKTFASLLRISAVEARERTHGFATVDLALIGAEVADLYDAAAEERGTRVRFRGCEGAFVLGDRDLLFEALANLVDNAVKHGGSDVEVTVERDRRGVVCLAVADRGLGIPAAEQKRVFSRFYRLERSRSTPGNGLGLSLVQAVAQLHRAAITLRSTEPGLRVELLFPRVTEAAGQTPRRAEKPHLASAEPSRGALR